MDTQDTPDTQEEIVIPPDVQGALARLTLFLAPTSVVDGVKAYVTNGRPELVDAFAALGWPDPYIEPPVELAEAESEPESKVESTPESTEGVF